MKYLILLFVVFYIQFRVNAETHPTHETITVKEEDVITYSGSKPMKVIAELNSLAHTCSIIHGDSFKITRISKKPKDKKIKMKVKKTAGVPGDQEICHIGSVFDVMGTYELIRTEEGEFQWISKISDPFILSSFDLTFIKEMKVWTESLEDTTSSTLTRVSLKTGETIAYPLSLTEVKVSATIKANNNARGEEEVSYDCFLASGDRFEISILSNYSHDAGQGFMFLTKIGEASNRDFENQDICFIGSRITVYIQNCRLTRTKEGTPEGLNCESPFNSLIQAAHQQEE